MTAVTEHVVQGGTLTIRPLQPTIGAEISGVDLTRPLSDADRDQIKAAILRYKVVFFRDQHLDQDQHAAFARRFGPLYTHPSTSKAYGALRGPQLRRLPPAARADPDRRRTPVRRPLTANSIGAPPPY